MRKRINADGHPGPIVNNSDEATSHYFNCNGQAADVGDQSTRELACSSMKKILRKKSN